MPETYETAGEGDHPVIALHGWFGSATAWQALRPHLNGSVFRYVFTNYRGYGARRGEPGQHTIEEAAHDALRLADHLGFDRFSLVGHSMGGSVMQKVLALAPHRVRALVGISPVPACGVLFDDETWALFSSAATDPAHRRAIIDMTTGNRLTRVWLDAAVRHSLENSDVEAFADYLTAWSGTDFHEEISGSPAQIKVIVGQHDPGLGEQTMRSTFAKWYPHCDIEVLANAGHYAMDEVPIALATSAEAFLASY